MTVQYLMCLQQYMKWFSTTFNVSKVDMTHVFGNLVIFLNMYLNMNISPPTDNPQTLP